MNLYTKLSIILLFISSCSSAKSSNEKETSSDSIKKESKATNKTMEVATESAAISNETNNDFSSYLSSFKELPLPSVFVPRDYMVQEEDLKSITADQQTKYIKPFTTKISEKDYPYNFNYPDFSSSNYKAIGKITLNDGVTFAIFSLFYESYTFLGIIAYDKSGNILNGKMIGEEEGGSQVTYLLKSNLDKSGNTITINSDYVEKNYDSKGKVTKKNPIKKTYSFNLKTKKFEEVK